MILDNRRANYIIIAISFLTFILSLSYSLYFRIDPMVDAAGYDNIAWNLVQGNGYKESAELSYGDDIAIMRVGPGYEFFLAAIYFVFGRNYLAVWIIQALLMGLSSLLIYWLSQEIFSGKGKIIGLIAAAFIGFSPDLITMNGMLMTETLGVFLVILSTYLFFKHINSDSNSLHFALLSAIIFSCAILVRTPVAILLLPFCYYFFTRRQWTQLLLFLAILTAIFIPWTIHNYQIYNSFIPTNLAFGYDLLAGNHHGATGELEPYARNEEFMSLGRIAGNKLAMQDALEFILFHPVEFSQITLARLSIYFSFARPTGFWFHLSGWSKILTLILSAIYSCALFIFGFWGAYTSCFGEQHNDRSRARFLLFMLLMMPLAIIGIIVETRYRFLVYPFFAVFAGYGLLVLMQTNIQRKYLFGIVALLFANTFVDALHNFDRVIEKIKDLI